MEVQGAYYHSSDANFYNIYSGGGIYGLEISVQSWRGLYTWASGNVFTKSGHSVGYNTPTHVTFIPIGVGLKYLWKIHPEIDGYVGAGVLPTYLWIHDHSPYLAPKTIKWGCGGIVKAGVLIDLPKSFFIDLCTDYFSVTVSTSPESAHLKGWTFGGGVGYRFGSR